MMTCTTSWLLELGVAAKLEAGDVAIGSLIALCKVSAVVGPWSLDCWVGRMEVASLGDCATLAGAMEVELEKGSALGGSSALEDIFVVGASGIVKELAVLMDGRLLGDCDSIGG